MSVVPVVEAELVELAEPVELVEPELELELELELQAATISIAATPAAVADVTRREPAPIRLRSVMEPPWTLSGLTEPPVRASELAPGVPCVTKNRSDVYACQCPATLRNTGDIKRRPGFTSDLCVSAGQTSDVSTACQPSGSGRAAGGEPGP